MAILKQKSNVTYYQGWYGLCKDDNTQCEAFPLISGSGMSSAYIHDSIDKIYEVSDNAEAEVMYDGTLTFPGAIATIALKELECGKCYRIKMKAGNGELDIPDFTYANRSDDDAEQDINNRITNDCNAGGGADDYAFTTITTISDTLDEGYTNGDFTIFDAERHEGVITSATGVEKVSIQADASGLQYSMNGTDWVDLTTSPKTITANFTDLQLRVKEGLNAGTHNRVVTLTATPENPQFISLTKNINYNITVNPVSISASKTITEEVEEGQSGSIHSFDISFQNLEGIGVTSTDPSHRIGLSETGNFGDGISIPNPSGTSVTIFVKLHGNMPGADVTSKFNVIGERRNSGPFITLTDAITITSRVAPRPQITGISINPNTLQVNISVEETEAPNNYGAHHWHYYVKDIDNNTVVSTKMPGWPSGGFPNVTIPFDFPVAGVYTLCAKIVDGSHNPIPGSHEVEQDFTIAANDATLSVNKVGISEILDIDENATTHVISISSNNLSNITSTQSFNSWDVLSATDSSISVKLKDSVKSTNLASGFVDIPQETLTITGDVAPRDTSTHKNQ